MQKTSESSVGKYLPAKLPQDFFLGLGIVLFGAALLIWIIPLQVNDAGSFGLPPSLAPRSLAWIIIACGAVLIFQNLKPTFEGDYLKLKEVAFLAACLASAGIMLILMSYFSELIDRPNAGFLLAAPMGLLTFTFLHSNAPVWAYAFNAIVAPSLIFAFFWWGLELPLP